MSTTLATRPWLPPAVDERTVPAPIDPVSYTVEIDALAELAWTVRPKLITIGGSLNLTPGPLLPVDPRQT